jgi:hypothetical protein
MAGVLSSRPARSCPALAAAVASPERSARRRAPGPFGAPRRTRRDWDERLASPTVAAPPNPAATGCSPKNRALATASLPRDGLPNNHGGALQWPNVDPSFKLIVQQAGREFMGSPLRQQPAKPFYHYTSVEGLAGIFGEEAIWATDYRHLDDSDELTRGEHIIESELEILMSQHGRDSLLGDFCSTVRQVREGRRVIDIPGIGIYVTSFSDEPEIPGQWRVYGCNFTGYAIGLNSLPLPVGEQTPTKLTSALSVDFGPCIYDDDIYRACVREIVTVVADGLLKYIDTYCHNPAQVELLFREARVSALARLGASVWFLKRPLYSGEQELRLVHVGKSPTSPLVRPCRSKNAEYIEVPLRKDERMDLQQVIVGSKGDHQRARQILDSTNYTDVPLIASSVTDS